MHPQTITDLISDVQFALHTSLHPCSPGHPLCVKTLVCSPMGHHHHGVDHSAPRPCATNGQPSGPSHPCGRPVRRTTAEPVADRSVRTAPKDPGGPCGGNESDAARPCRTDSFRPQAHAHGRRVKIAEQMVLLSGRKPGGKLPSLRFCEWFPNSYLDLDLQSTLQTSSTKIPSSTLQSWVCPKICNSQ